MAFGSVEFFRKAIRLALFVVLPASLLALLLSTIGFVAALRGNQRRIAGLEARIAQLEASAAPTSSSTRTATVHEDGEPGLSDTGTSPHPTSTVPESAATSAPSHPTATSAPAEPTLAPLPDSAPAPQLRQRLVPLSAPTAKTVYLTFDDGPSARTMEILDILDRSGIRATFFVINQKGDAAAERLREIVRRGHAVGMHTATHDYARIYASVDNFVRDLGANYDFIFQATGVAPQVFRCAGGSVNSHNRTTGDAIQAEMNLRGFRAYDWNCSTGDANPVAPDADRILANVVASSKNKDRLILLAHDTASKGNVVEALPRIVAHFTDLGYGFAVLTPDVPPVAFHLR